MSYLFLKISDKTQYTIYFTRPTYLSDTLRPFEPLQTLRVSSVNIRHYQLV